MSSSVTEKLGEKLKDLRKKQGLTQSEVAEKIGTTRSTLASWELGVREPNAIELHAIRNFFNVSGDYLAGFTEECTTIDIPKVYNIDLNKLNVYGKHMLFEFYNFLKADDTYVK